MKLWKVFYAIILALFFLPAGHEAHAAQAVMPDTMAMEMSRKSFVMHDENGKIYNVYIIGDDEMFVGAKHFTWLSGRDIDQVYKAYPYNAYLSAPGERSAEIQYVQLFGKKMDTTRPDFINVTAPTYIGGVYVIQGEDGQPDMLVTTKQMSVSFVDYHFFIIKNGELRPMRFMHKDRSLRMAFIGVHKPARGLDDGTIAIPWFRQGHTGAGKSGSFITVFMPDFTNMILISSYTIND